MFLVELLIGIGLVCVMYGVARFAYWLGERHTKKIKD